MQRSGRKRRRADSSGARISSSRGLPFEDGAEAVLDDDGEPEVGTEAFQDVERGGGEDAIAERPEPQNGHPAARRQTCENAIHVSLFFDLRLVHQHDRDLIADRVDAVALDAFEPAVIGLQLDHGLANGAHENFQQFFADSHSETTV